MFVTLPALPRPTVVSLPARCVRLGSATGHAPNPAPRIVSAWTATKTSPPSKSSSGPSRSLLSRPSRTSGSTPELAGTAARDYDDGRSSPNGRPTGNGSSSSSTSSPRSVQNGCSAPYSALITSQVGFRGRGCPLGHGGMFPCGGRRRRWSPCPTRGRPLGPSWPGDTYRFFTA